MDWLPEWIDTLITFVLSVAVVIWLFYEHYRSRRKNDE